jgi:pimeloyl-ACP methyl ester carboxylesterase
LQHLQARAALIFFSRLSAILCAVCVWSASAAPFPAGASEQNVDVAGTSLQVYAYKPPAYDGGPILVVLHGLGRNAAGYRDYARPLADRYGYLVIAPLFDRARFPTWRYQQGGIARLAGDTVHPGPPAVSTGDTIEQLVVVVRDMEQAPMRTYSVLGHSAGAQALTRYAAFTQNEAMHIAVANPSTYLWPSREVRYPYGYGGLPAALADDTALRRYLAQPLVVLLGTADVKQDPDLNVRPGAMAQGPNRYERGLNFFHTGEQIAQERGWPFAWRLLEVPGVGHSARRMFASEAAAAAFAHQP